MMTNRRALVCTLIVLPMFLTAPLRGSQQRC
jgi:uncharacterized membrane protein